MSTDEVDSVDGGGARSFWGWGTMLYPPAGGDAPVTELSCTQCYYVFWIVVDCRTCTNYVGSSSNTECRYN